MEIHPYLGRVLYFLIKTALLITKQVTKGLSIPSFDMSCLSESFRVTKQAKGGNVVTYYTAMVTVVENGDAGTQGTVKFPSACS